VVVIFLEELLEQVTEWIAFMIIWNSAVINGMALQRFINKRNAGRVCKRPLEAIAEPYQKKSDRHLRKQNRNNFFLEQELGNPYFTTDTAAVLVEKSIQM
jgi:uridylate kinase